MVWGVVAGIFIAWAGAAVMVHAAVPGGGLADKLEAAPALYGGLMLGAAVLLAAVAVVVAQQQARPAGRAAAQRAEREAEAARAAALREEAQARAGFVAGVLARRAARVRSQLAQRPALETPEDRGADLIDDDGTGAFYVETPPALERLYDVLPALSAEGQSDLERLVAVLDEVQALTRRLPVDMEMDTTIDRALLDRKLRELIRLAGRLRGEGGGGSPSAAAGGGSTAAAGSRGASPAAQAGPSADDRAGEKQSGAAAA